MFKVGDRVRDIALNLEGTIVGCREGSLLPVVVRFDNGETDNYTLYGKFLNIDIAPSLIKIEEEGEVSKMTNEQKLATVLVDLIERISVKDITKEQSEVYSLAREVLKATEQESKFKTGMKVTHPKYGEGTIVAVWQTKVTYPMTVEFVTPVNGTKSRAFTRDGRYSTSEEPSLEVLE